MRWLVATLLPVVLAATVAVAAPTPIDLETDFRPGSHDRFHERVNSAQQTDYHAVLAGYAARREKYPEDILSQVERCRFIERFAYLEEVTIESASDDLEACRAELGAGPHARETPVLLYGVESKWGDESITEARALLPAAEKWNEQDRARLYELLAQRLQWSEGEEAGKYASMAVSLDPGSAVLLIAVEYNVRLGAKSRARRMIKNAPESTWDKVSRAMAAQMLLDLGDDDGATALLKVERENNDVDDDLALARVLAKRGEYDEARKLYRRYVADEEGYLLYGTRLEYFEFERRHGDKDLALAAYEKLRAEGYSHDVLARHRLGLLFAHPTAGWSWRDGLGLLTLLGLFVVICVLPLVVLAPVHYRGLALRAGGIAPDLWQTGWRLRHAWYALAVFLVSGYAALYVLAPSYVESLVPLVVSAVAIEASTPVSDLVLADVMLWSTLAILVLLVPLVRGKSLRAVLLGTWSIGKSIGVGLGFALLLKLFAIVFGLAFQSTGMLGSDTVRSMQGLNESYGLAVMLLVSSLLVPVVEEWVFRGVLLEAFRGHVSFWLAAVMQALAFVLMHEGWQVIPFLFVFAMTAAWLVRRSGGLLAGIVFHATNNLLVSLAIVGATSAINRF